MMHIGDHQINDIFAHSLGINVLWFNNNGALWEQDFQKPNEFSNFQNLENIIKKNMNQDELSKAIINIIKRKQAH